MNLTNVPMSHPVFADSRWHDAAWQHTAVMALFSELGDGNARANAQVLFRVEPEIAAADATRGRVLVQSTVPPERHTGGIRNTDLDMLLRSYQAGQAVQIVLRANTVRTINRTGADGVERRHRARIPDHKLEAWLQDRLAPTVQLHLPARITPGQLRRGRAQLITTTFHATGTVHDPDRLAHLVRDGIGRARAYGCGMLTAIPT